jgi:CRISPR-associated endonuclease Cas3-HD
MIFSWPGEDLFEHGREVASIGDCLFTQEILYYNALLRELEGESNNWWRVAAALHDIGKAHKRYQETIRKKPNFKCHEFFSAVYIWEALEAGPKTRATLALTVLLHHHAMNRFKDCEQKLKRFEPAEEFACYVAQFSKWLGVKLRQVQRLTIDFKSLINEINQKKVNRIAVIGVGPLVVADHVASAKRGNPSALFREITREIQHRLDNCVKTGKPPPPP